MEDSRAGRSVLENFQLSYYGNDDLSKQYGAIAFHVIKAVLPKEDLPVKDMKGGPGSATQSFGLALTIPQRPTFLMQARTLREVDDWLNVLRIALEAYQELMGSKKSGSGISATPPGSPAGSRLHTPPPKLSPLTLSPTTTSTSITTSSNTTSTSTTIRTPRSDLVQHWEGYSRPSAPPLSSSSESGSSKRPPLTPFKLALSLQDGSISGSGFDEKGEFLWRGSYEGDLVTLTKIFQSDMTHHVTYKGTFRMNRYVLDGTFEDSLTGETGQFHVEASLEKLNGVVGLNSVKAFVKELRNQLIIADERKRLGLPLAGMGTLHMVFKGNPGTGKTTVARIIADMLRELGVLRTGHLVEADRSSLVVGFVGQTAGKTLKVAETALGGVLFIDEAYALTRNTTGNDFGMEAVDTLVKYMEDHREDLVVILAGYSNEMDDMLKANPGMLSRFPTVIEFSDYSAPELMEIAMKQLTKVGFEMTKGARERLTQIFEEHIRISTEKAQDNGNGRFVRNLLEKMYRQQSTRLAHQGYERTREDLTTVLPEDWVYLL